MNRLILPTIGTEGKPAAMRWLTGKPEAIKKEWQLLPANTINKMVRAYTCLPKSSECSIVGYNPFYHRVIVLLSTQFRAKQRADQLQIKKQLRILSRNCFS